MEKIKMDNDTGKEQGQWSNIVAKEREKHFKVDKMPIYVNN